MFSGLLCSRAGTITKSSSIERVRVPKIVFERVSSEYLKIISSTRATRVCSSSTRVPLKYFVSSKTFVNYFFVKQPKAQNIVLYNNFMNCSNPILSFQQYLTKIQKILLKIRFHKSVICPVLCNFEAEITRRVLVEQFLLQNCIKLDKLRIYGSEFSTKSSRFLSTIVEKTKLD